MLGHSPPSMGATAETSLVSAQMNSWVSGVHWGAGPGPRSPHCRAADEVSRRAEHVTVGTGWRMLLVLCS